MLGNPIPIGSTDSQSIIKQNEIFKIKLKLKDAKPGTELFRLLPALNDGEYEYFFENGNHKYFEIKTMKLDFKKQKQSLYTLVVAQRIIHAKTFLLKFVGYVKGDFETKKSMHFGIDVI